MIGHRTITIEHLPNEVFLGIFSFHRLLSGSYLPLAVGRPPSAAWRWHTLAHVCQRWRDIIFSSLRHLETRLIIPRKSPKTPLDSWPALPLSVWYSHSNKYMPKEQKADVVAAFDHSDRIREICLPTEMDDSFWTSIGNKSFLELERLELYGPPTITLPHEFLGRSGPLPRLRRILLDDLHLPTLPQLLFSGRGLVSLHLGPHTLTGDGFIPPEVLATALSSTTQLEYLRVVCLEFHPELTNPNSSPHNLVVLPALTYFYFWSYSEYLENFVSWINAPHLLKLIVRIDKSGFDVPQLSQFISRTEQLSSFPVRTSISLSDRVSEIEHHFRRLPYPQEASFIYSWSGCRVGWEVSQVGHICARLSPLASSVKQLTLYVSDLPPIQRKTDPAPWLQFLTPYNSVEEIEVFGQGALCTGFACALQQSTWKAAQELLPALRVLKIHGFNPRLIRLTMLFATARQLTGRPVIVHPLDQD